MKRAESTRSRSLEGSISPNLEGSKDGGVSGTAVDLEVAQLISELSSLSYKSGLYFRIVTLAAKELGVYRGSIHYGLRTGNPFVLRVVARLVSERRAALSEARQLLHQST